MTVESTTGARWSPRRWVTTISVILFVQVAAIIYLGERQTPMGPLASYPGGWTYMGSVNPERLDQEFPFVSDPTLLALPNLRGFSGPAWLSYHPARLSFQPWQAKADWIEFDPSGLGASMISQSVTNDSGARVPLGIAELPLPRRSSMEFGAASRLLATQSELRLMGELAERTLMGPLALPSWPHKDVLVDTVIETVVDAAGHTLLAVIASTSGLPAADEWARNVASSVRFNSVAGPNLLGPVLGSPPLALGQMVFRWHTVAPAGSNTPASTAQATPTP